MCDYTLMSSTKNADIIFWKIINHFLVFKTSLNPFTVFVYKSTCNLLENITYGFLIFPWEKIIQILPTKFKAWLKLTKVLAWVLIPPSKPQPCNFFCPPGQTKSPDNSNTLNMFNNNIYTNFKTADKHMLILRWCHAQELFGSRFPVTTGGFEL